MLDIINLLNDIPLLYKNKDLTIKSYTYLNL